MQELAWLGLHLSQKRTKETRLAHRQLAKSGSQALLGIRNIPDGIKLPLTGKHKLGVGRLVARGVFDIYEVLIVWYAGILRKLEQTWKKIV